MGQNETQLIYYTIYIFYINWDAIFIQGKFIWANWALTYFSSGVGSDTISLTYGLKRVKPMRQHIKIDFHFIHNFSGEC